MNRQTIILSIVALGCTFLLSSISDSEAKLWDYIVEAEFLENTSSQVNNPVVTGTVVDHAYRPVPDVDVKVTFAGQSYMLQTDQLGEFGKQFDGSLLKPRTYTVQIFVTSDDGKKGMARTTLQIDGHTEKSAKYEKQIEFMEIANDPSKLRKNSNDPISEILYNHYLKLQEKSIHAQNEEKLLEKHQQEIKEIRQIVNEKLLETLEERPLITRQFDDSTKLGKFLLSLDDQKRQSFELQLNSTKLRFSEAQIIMQEIMINGGTHDEARKAYLDHLSITQEEMNSIITDIEESIDHPKYSTNSTSN